MALLNSFNSGVAGIKTFSKSLEVIGDNIANVNSTGFKGSRVTNQDNFSETLKYSSAAADPVAGTNAMQVGTGSSVASISQRFTQGALSTTGGPTDLGITGKGFFKVQNTSTEEFFYTRAGDFRLDDTGNLLTNQGLSVMGIGNTPIKIDPLTGTNPLQSFKIEKDGTVLAYYANGTAPINKGQVLLTGFANPNALMRVGDNLLSNGTQTDGAADGPAGATDGTADTNSLYGNIIQGTLELSNVDLTQQFSDLIVAQRAFQANSRVITVSDSVMDEIVNLKR
ncbi:MAG: flagellar hook-basal body complex protein [Terrimicrobiaceae bacterium]